MSQVELQNAIHGCLAMSPKGRCTDGRHGDMMDWDISRVSSLSGMFWEAESFDMDLSKWDVSRARHEQNVRRYQIF